MPERLVVFAPHPDDAAISAGALLVLAALEGIPTTVALLTDGSEARLAAGMKRARRGRIRVAEAREEIRRLGLPPRALRLLRHRDWFEHHRTPKRFLHADLSLRDVAGFRPGPFTAAAVEEIRSVVGRGRVLCCAPHPRDRLLMHRITTTLVLEAVRPFPCGLLFYECLSTEPRASRCWNKRLGCRIGAPFAERYLLVREW
jgi:LmbE family N-acetylglucosaminyl deacetylase